MTSLNRLIINSDYNMDTTLKGIMELKLVGRSIIACGEDWIQLDNGQKIYLAEDEVQTIVG